MNITHLSGYRLMWLFVMFDLPTFTAENRKEAADFRKILLDEGFQMVQYSVYARPCASKEVIESMEKRISLHLPKGGVVEMLQITDKQFEKIHTYYGKKKCTVRNNPKQVVIFQNSWESFLPTEQNFNIF